MNRIHVTIRATSATGEDLAKLYYQQGFNLILISMHESKLKKLKSTIIKSKSENSQEYKVDKTNKAVSSQVFDSQFLHRFISLINIKLFQS